jgi:glycosyltransferase involved in cell wall biosynthesis
VDPSDVSVVICCFSLERWDALVDAVESVRQQEPAAREILVVVDGNEVLYQRARSDFRGVRVLRSSGPRGLSAARNTGLEEATGEVIAFLDDDAVAAPGWLRSLVGPYAMAGVLGVGGSVAPLWSDGRPASFPPEFDWVVGCTYAGMPRTRAEVRNMIGANMSVRSGVFGAVGGFDGGLGRIGSYPAGCEETEFCIRARRALPDALFVYEPEARVGHHVPRERASWRYFARRCYAEGLSKARVARLAGADLGLASERSYVARTLPSGIAHSLGAAVRERRVDGLYRAARIVAGLALTTVGYAVGRIRLALARPRRSAA